MPDSVETLQSNVFQWCDNLTQITLSKNISEIPYMMVRGCSKLTNITIPDNVTKIGFAAFEDCSGLASINISKYVTLIQDTAFIGCTGLKSIIVDNENTKYTNYNDGVLYRKDSPNYFIQCYPTGKTGSTFTIPDGINDEWYIITK